LTPESAFHGSRKALAAFYTLQTNEVAAETPHLTHKVRTGRLISTRHAGLSFPESCKANSLGSGFLRLLAHYPFNPGSLDAFFSWDSNQNSHIISKPEQNRRNPLNDRAEMVYCGLSSGTF